MSIKSLRIINLAIVFLFMFVSIFAPITAAAREYDVTSVNRGNLVAFSGKESVTTATYSTNKSESEGHEIPQPLKSLHLKKIVKELKDKRGANVKHFLMEDGSYTAEISLSPVHFQDKNGEWQDIRTTLSDEADIDDVSGNISKHFDQGAKNKAGKIDRNQSDYRALKVPFDVKVPKDYRKGYSIGKSNDRLSFKPIDANKSVGVVDSVYGNQIHYYDTWPQTDVSLIVQNDGIKEFLYLKNESAPKTFSFEMNRKPDGHNSVGELRIADLWLQDANGVIRNVDSRIEEKGNKIIFHLDVDTEGLTYPIAVDPSVVLNSTADAHVYSGAPTTSYGSNATIATGLDNAGQYIAYFNFDMSFLANRQIQNAVLELYELGMGQVNSSSMEVVAARVTSPWTESVTWNTRPTLEVKPSMPTATVTDGEKGVLWFVTSIVQDIANSNQNNGLALYQKTGAGGAAWFVANNMPGSTRKPKLHIAYVANVPNPTISLSKEGWSNQNVTFSIANDPANAGLISRTEYLINNEGWGPWVTYTSPVTVSTEGTTTIRARNIGTGGDIGSEIVKYIKIDKTAPKDPSHSNSLVLLSSTSLELTWNAYYDPYYPSGVARTLIYAQRWNGTAWEDTVDINNGGLPEYSMELPPGLTSYIINYLPPNNKYRFIAGRHVDQAGNFGAYTWREIWLDSLPPTSPTINLSSSAWTSSNVSFTIAHGTDSGSGVSKSQYKIGSGAWTDYSTTVTITTEGTSTITARTIDASGNISPEATASIKIDKQRPVDSSTFSAITPTSVQISSLFNDPSPSSGLSQIVISAQKWDGAAWAYGVDITGDGVPENSYLLSLGSAAHTVTGLQPGSRYRFLVETKDLAGNISASSWKEVVTTLAVPNAPTGIVVANEWAAQGTGYVNLAWTPIQGAIGYKIGIFNGYNYEWFDVGNVLAWSTQNKFIFPTRSLVDTWGTNTQAVVFNHNLGQNVNGSYGEIWDNPRDLYLKTLGTTYDAKTNYWFRISAYNSNTESAGSLAFTPTLENRTIPQIKYFYDAAGRLDYFILPDGRMVDYQYDANGNLITVVRQ